MTHKQAFHQIGILVEQSKADADALIRCAFCSGSLCQQVGPAEGPMQITWHECLVCRHFTMQNRSHNRSDQTFLGDVEKLIDQILFKADVPRTSPLVEVPPVCGARRY